MHSLARVYQHMLTHTRTLTCLSQVKTLVHIYSHSCTFTTHVHTHRLTHMHGHTSHMLTCRLVHSHPHIHKHAHIHMRSHSGPLHRPLTDIGGGCPTCGCPFPCVRGERGPTSCSRRSPSTTVTPCLPSSLGEVLGRPVSRLWVATSEDWQPASTSAPLPTCSAAVETGHHGAGPSGTLPGTGAPGGSRGKETGKDLGSARWDGGQNETAKMGTKT